MHVHVFFNGRIILPSVWHGSARNGGCRKAGLIRYIHSGRWLDVAIFRTTPTGE